MLVSTGKGQSPVDRAVKQVLWLKFLFLYIRKIKLDIIKSARLKFHRTYLYCGRVAPLKTLQKAARLCLVAFFFK